MRNTSVTTMMCAFFLVAQVSWAKERAYRPPRLPDGRPDLQGVWDQSNATPLTRLKEFDTLVISRKQADEIEAQIRGFLVDPSSPSDPGDELMTRRLEPVRGQLRSSIIVDPPDGRLPWKSTFAKWEDDLIEKEATVFDGAEARPTSERCLSDSASQPPILYNPAINLHQIVQTTDTLVFYSEPLHEARLIRINGKHVPSTVTSWLGDSIGRWEGDSLVVETRYFAPTSADRMAPFIMFRLAQSARLVERFTLVSKNQLDYTFTVDDPESYSRPWSGETHFLRSNESMHEYACHEGNYSLPFALRSARAVESTRTDAQNVSAGSR